MEQEPTYHLEGVIRSKAAKDRCSEWFDKGWFLLANKLFTINRSLVISFSNGDRRECFCWRESSSNGYT